MTVKGAAKEVETGKEVRRIECPDPRQYRVQGAADDTVHHALAV